MEEQILQAILELKVEVAELRCDVKYLLEKRKTWKDFGMEILKYSICLCVGAIFASII